MNARRLLVSFVALVVSLVFSASAVAAPSPADVQRGLQRLVAAAGGPPGAIATIYRDGRLTVAARGPG